MALNQVTSFLKRVKIYLCYNRKRFLIPRVFLELLYSKTLKLNFRAVFIAPHTIQQQEVPWVCLIIARKKLKNLKVLF